MIGEAERLEPAQPPGILRQAGGGDQALGIDDARQLAEEPRVELAGGVDVVHRQPGAQRLRGHQQPVRARFGQRGAERVGPAIAGRLDLIEPGEPGLHAAQALLQRLGEAAPDRHGLADRFHRWW